MGLQMFLDFNSQKSWPAEVVVKASGSCSPRTSGGPRLETTAIKDNNNNLDGLLKQHLQIVAKVKMVDKMVISLCRA